MNTNSYCRQFLLFSLSLLTGLVSACDDEARPKGSQALPSTQDPCEILADNACPEGVEIDSFFCDEDGNLQKCAKAGENCRIVVNFSTCDYGCEDGMCLDDPCESCSDDKPHCSDKQKCVECTSNSHCSDGSLAMRFCIDGQCGECRHFGDCAGEEITYCNQDGDIVTERADACNDYTYVCSFGEPELTEQCPFGCTQQDNVRCNECQADQDCEEAPDVCRSDGDSHRLVKFGRSCKDDQTCEWPELANLIHCPLGCLDKSETGPAHCGRPCEVNSCNEGYCKEVSDVDFVCVECLEDAHCADQPVHVPQCYYGDNGEVAVESYLLVCSENNTCADTPIDPREDCAPYGCYSGADGAVCRQCRNNLGVQEGCVSGEVCDDHGRCYFPGEHCAEQLLHPGVFETYNDNAGMTIRICAGECDARGHSCEMAERHEDMVVLQLWSHAVIPTKWYVEYGNRQVVNSDWSRHDLQVEIPSSEFCNTVRIAVEISNPDPNEQWWSGCQEHMDWPNPAPGLEEMSYKVGLNEFIELEEEQFRLLDSNACAGEATLQFGLIRAADGTVLADDFGCLEE